MTNYEWIKTLSIEELADKILDKRPCQCCAYLTKAGTCGVGLYPSCAGGYKLWLQQEYRWTDEED